MKLESIISECINNEKNAFNNLKKCISNEDPFHIPISNSKLLSLSKLVMPSDIKEIIDNEIENRKLSYGKLKENFLNCKSGKDLAEILRVSYSGLLYNLNLVGKKKRLYTEFSIPKKSGGSRNISAPNNALLNLQKRLNHILNIIYTPPKSAHGFISGNLDIKNKYNIRSIVSNAQNHKNKKLLLNIDLENFFPSITGKRIYKLFQSQPFNFDKKLAGLLTQICIHDVERSLPQGAPTSPVISNMIALRLDLKLLKLAKENNIIYTRYADDLTFSTIIKEFPEKFIDSIREIINEEGFKINESKFRIQSKKIRQEVTGLIVNKKVNVSRKYFRNVKAMLNNLEKKGLDECQKILNSKYSKYKKGNTPKFEDVLLGKIEFIGNVRGKTKGEDPFSYYIKLKDKYESLLKPKAIEEISAAVPNKQSEIIDKSDFDKMKDFLDS